MKYVYWGIAHPPGVTREEVPRKINLHANNFYQRDLDRLDLAGLPHHVDHNEYLKVGEVIKSWTSKDGNLWVKGIIDMDVPVGRWLVDEIENGRMTELSLNHTIISTNYGRVYSTKIKKFTEISSVSKALRPGCRIMSGAILDDDE